LLRSFGFLYFPFKRSFQLYEDKREASGKG
jgi:hypothetical protein